MYRLAILERRTLPFADGGEVMLDRSWRIDFVTNSMATVQFSYILLVLALKARFGVPFERGIPELSNEHPTHRTQRGNTRKKISVCTST